MRKKIIYTQIFTSLLIGFFISRILIKNVFIANSPRIQSDLASGATNFLASILQPGSTVSKLSEAELKEMNAVVKSNVLQPMSRGVYAAEDAKRTYTIVKENEVEWLEYTYVVDGKTVKIRVPKGTTPPTQETVEKLY